jgi:hypothetical protein
LGSANASYGVIFEKCSLQLGANNATARLVIAGTTGSSIKDGYVEWLNTTVQFANASQGILNQQGRLFWRNTTSAVSGANLPTNLFIGLSSNVGIADIVGIDLSALGSGKTLVNIGTNNLSVYKFRNCKLNASVGITTGAVVGQGGTEVYLLNCDSGSVNLHNEGYVYQGSWLQETTKVKSGGATDGTTNFSLKLVSLSPGPSFHSPLRSPPIRMYNDATGSSVTLSIDILHDNVTLLKDNEVWVEVEYLTDSGDPLGSIVTSRTADDLTTPANQGTSSASWTTTGMTNPNMQKLSVAFTPQMKGWVRARVALAKPGYTIYVDPLIQGLAPQSKVYLDSNDGSYINEAGAGFRRLGVQGGFVG